MCETSNADQAVCPPAGLLKKNLSPVSARSYQSDCPRAVATLITLASGPESFQEKPRNIKTRVVLSYTNKSGEDKNGGWNLKGALLRLPRVDFYSGAAGGVRSESAVPGVQEVTWGHGRRLGSVSPRTYVGKAQPRCSSAAHLHSCCTETICENKCYRKAPWF